MEAMTNPRAAWRYLLCRWTNKSLAVQEDGQWVLLIPDWTQDEPERRRIPERLIKALLRARLVERKPRQGWVLSTRGRRLRSHLRTILNYRYAA